MYMLCSKVALIESDYVVEETVMGTLPCVRGHDHANMFLFSKGCVRTDVVYFCFS